jgi:hypothetical protein
MRRPWVSCERPKDAEFRATSGREPVMKEKLRFLGLDVHAPWASRLLFELGHEAIVAYARNVRLTGESRRKDDRLDA